MYSILKNCFYCSIYRKLKTLYTSITSPILIFSVIVTSSTYIIILACTLVMVNFIKLLILIYIVKSLINYILDVQIDAIIILSFQYD